MRATPPILLFALAYLLVAPVSAREGLQWEEIPLQLIDPSARTIGPLRWMGGLSLTHDDPRFGGYSGLSITPGPEGRLQLLAVSDTGHWLKAALRLDAEGRLRGLEGAALLPMYDTRGAVLAGKKAADAESVRWSRGHWLVTFERDHRVWRYPSDLRGAATAIPAPSDLATLPENKGIEAMTPQADGSLVLLSERGRAPGGGLKGWVGRPDTWRPLRYQDADDFLPTDVAALPRGDLLVLERRYRPLLGVAARLRRIPRSQLEGGELKPELLVEMGPGYSVDNMEGIAIVPRGEWIDVFLISDDNKSPAQRTLLMHFRAPATALQPPSAP